MSGGECSERCSAGFISGFCPLSAGGVDGVDEGESCIWESSPSEAARKGLEWFEGRESEESEELGGLEELVGKEGERGGVRRGNRVPERLAMFVGMVMGR